MEFIFFPVFIAKNIGMEAAFVLSELITSDINKVMIKGGKWTKVQLTTLKSSKIGFLSDDQIKLGLEQLCKSGLLIRMIKSGKKTTFYSVNALNLMFIEVLHEKYFDIILPYTCKGYDGNFINIELFENNVKSSDIKKSNLSFCGGLLYDITKIHSKKFLKEVIESVYKIDINNLNKYLTESDGKYILDFSKEKMTKDGYPKYISSLILPYDIDIVHKNLKIMQFSHLYNGIVDVGEVGQVKILSPLINFIEQENLIEEIIEEEREVEEHSLRELARNSYESFCKYMEISISLKKPIADWVAKDFVSYFYCGMAKVTVNNNKDNGTSEEIKFPDFRKDCTFMKRYIERYGNKKLAEMIKTLILNYEDIKLKYRIKELSLHIGVFGVEWIVSKIEDYMKYRHELDLSSEVNFRVREIQKEEKEEKSELEKIEKDAILAKLRQNINGEPKNG